MLGRYGVGPSLNHVSMSSSTTDTHGLMEPELTGPNGPYVSVQKQYNAIPLTGCALSMLLR